MSAPSNHSALPAVFSAMLMDGAGEPPPATSSSDWRTKPVDQLTTADFIAEAQYRVAELTVDMRDGQHGHQLCRPACGSGCAPCFYNCAVARIKLDWWRRELSKLYREAREA